VVRDGRSAAQVDRHDILGLVIFQRGQDAVQKLIAAQFFIRGGRGRPGSRRDVL
jgi:hypothetical protein|tara:strand:+ start:5571 stop:5732 length:162 start_codon:yes stop_codon:yes gene_type:complete